ncbi:MAG: hypothetical protein JXR03_17525 [Cyclobacteriaceae bacterium]
MENILVAAKNNSQSLEEIFEKLEPSQFQEFLAFLEAKKEFSVTLLKGLIKVKEIDLSKLKVKPSFCAVLETGEYKNGWQVSPANPESHFGKFAEQRKTFDLTFEDGEKFKYLALTAGTLGVPFWGDFTLVFDPNKFDNTEYAALRYNSLRKSIDGLTHYYFDGKKVDLKKLEKDLAEPDNLKRLAVIKLEKEITQVAPKDYPKTLLRELKGDHRDYIEVIAWKKLKLEDCLSAIRFKKSYYVLIENAIQKAFRTKNGDVLGESYQNLSELNKLLVHYKKNKDIKLDLIE